MQPITPKPTLDAWLEPNLVQVMQPITYHILGRGSPFRACWPRKGVTVESSQQEKGQQMRNLITLTTLCNTYEHQFSGDCIQC
jgi:hypothetical protein